MLIAGTVTFQSKSMILSAAFVVVLQYGETAKLSDPSYPPIPSNFGRTSDRDLHKEKELSQIEDFTSKAEVAEGNSPYHKSVRPSSTAAVARKKGTRRGNGANKSKVGSNHYYYDSLADTQDQQASTYGTSYYSKIPEYQNSYLSYPRQTTVDEYEKTKISEEYLAKLKQFYERPDKGVQTSYKPNDSNEDKTVNYEKFLKYAYKHYGHQFPDYFKYLQDSKSNAFSVRDSLKDTLAGTSSIQDIFERSKSEKLPTSLYGNYLKFGKHLNSDNTEYQPSLHTKPRLINFFDNPLDEGFSQHSTEEGFGSDFSGPSGGRKRNRPPGLRGNDDQEFFVEDSISVGRPKGRPRNKNCSGTRCRKQVRPELGRNGIFERGRRPRRPRI